MDGIIGLSSNAMGQIKIKNKTMSWIALSSWSTEDESHNDFGDSLSFPVAPMMLNN